MSETEADRSGRGIATTGRSFLRCRQTARSGRGSPTRLDAPGQEDRVRALGKDIMRDWRRWSRLERWLGVTILMLALLSVPAAVLFERDTSVAITTEAIAAPGAAN